MPITRRITETQYQKDIADAEKRGFAAARERLDDDPGVAPTVDACADSRDEARGDQRALGGRV